MSCYLSLDQRGTYEQKIRRSRFLGYAEMCVSENDITGLLDAVKERHSDATHVCWAYLLKTGAFSKEHSTDGGEPSGSAGKPMLGAIRQRNLENVAVAVVRYFGGVRLGIRGLIEAYSTTAAGAVDAGGVSRYCDGKLIELKVSYNAWNHFERTRELFSRCSTTKVDFGANVDAILAVEEERVSSIMHFFDRQDCLCRLGKENVLIKLPVDTSIQGD